LRIRSIKPEFWRSEDVKQLPREVRLLFIGLWSYVDDNGVGVDDHRQISADLFALEDDPIGTRAYVRDGLATLSAASLIARYAHGGKRYLYVLSWDKHQRVDKPARPRYPRPDEGGVSVDDPLTCGNVDVQSDPRTDVARDPGESREAVAPGTGEQGNRGTDKQKTSSSAGPRKRGTRIPDDFAVTPEMVAWARERVPHVDGRLETEKFVNHWQAKTGRDATKLDWIATWRNWMLNATSRSPAGASPNGNGLVERNGRKLKPETAARLDDQARWAAIDAASSQPAIEGPAP